jgi:hypothetical protein
MHVLLVEVVDESGGGIRSGGDKDGDGAILVPVGNERRDLGLVLENAGSATGEKGDFFFRRNGVTVSLIIV